MSERRDMAGLVRQDLVILDYGPDGSGVAFYARDQSSDDLLQWAAAEGRRLGYTK